MVYGVWYSILNAALGQPFFPQPQFITPHLLLVFRYVKHCTWVSSEAYSSPSIVLIANTPDGGRVIFDDYRYAGSVY